ncbi:hypothetical protein [Carboxylicivirga sp. N1Y90]|uniref:hypothetical protein n=1 Tax=Carboxylicivirga fragile TaxID=3417571 RepID=UPI003D342313|nr:hypothetical protein [Marinilabiliaceae bacterium N1Y90]
MKRRYALIGILLLSYLDIVIAQDLNYTGPISHSMAKTKTMDHTVWSTLSNASNTAYLKHITIAAAYQMPHSIKELSSRAIVAVYPSQLGSFSALINQNGYHKSQLSKYGLSYSRAFGKNYSAFFQLNYISHQIIRSNTSDAFYSSLGMLIKATNALQIGIYIQNPEQGKISYSSHSFALPSYFNAGLEWSAGSAIKILGEIEKKLDHPTNYKVAGQFAMRERLFVRFGINGKPSLFTFGAGFILQQLQFDAGFSYHQQLGMTSGIGISYAFHKKSN